ncbi:hypothetical protein [Nocardia cyriacigeorgica]|uniref:hypothetical protein n=1 Tax=Nocardia cyriacigeorgica TaxID=135487 RepID=UPI002455B4BA|nr:hypothetical protein [Nocardia cyriacigeorgica]
MPAEDPGDVFLRNRGAVLDALLSDPALGSSGGGAVTDRPASAAAPTGNAPDPELMASIAAAAAAAARPAPPGPRRRATHASEPNKALLSRQSPESGSQSALGTD